MTEFKFFAAKPERIDITMEITMPLARWKLLAQESINKKTHIGCDFYYAIMGVVADMSEKFEKRVDDEPSQV